VNQLFGWGATISRGEYKLYFAGLVNNIVLRAVLVTKCVSSDDNWFSPSGNKSGNVFNYNRFTDYCSIQNVPDGSIGWFPHLFEIEFLDSLLVWGNGSAFDSDFVFKHSIWAVDSDLIFGFVSVFNWKVIVFSFQVKIRMNMLLLNPIPDNFCHLISINVDYCASNFNLPKSSRKSAL